MSEAPKDAPKDLIVDGDNLVCPQCKAVNSVIEVDSCVRWNRAEVRRDADGTFVLDIAQGQSDFQTDGYICGTCNTDVELPDNSETVWC